MSTLVVLVAEDEFDIRELLVEFLEAEGYRVVQASNGQQCLDRYAEQRPNVLILDLMMPLLSGEDVLIALTAGATKPAPVPVILTTAGDGERVAKRYRCEKLDKPYDVYALLRLVDRLATAT